MATGTLQDFKIYNAEFQAGLWEGITQMVQAFNGASSNAIQLITESLKGEYAKQAFFQDISDLITRRDVTSTSAAGAKKLEQDEIISVKLNRKIGPVETTLDSIRKIAADQQEISFMLGEMVGQKKAQDMLNTGILGVEAALAGQSDVIFDATALGSGSTATLTTDHLVSGLSKMGDMAERVVAWVMHSKPYWNLTRSQITDKVVNVADRVIREANPATLNRPVILSDIPALHDANGSATDTYNVLGLVRGGVQITESEQSEIVSETVTGNENILFRMQGEYAVNLQCKGFKWDTVNGGANPTDAAVATSSNWDKVASSYKDLAGVRIVVQ